MILRPFADDDLLELCATIAADGKLPLDARAVLIRLLLDRKLEDFPKHEALRAMLVERADGKPIGSGRLARLLKDLISAGYLVRATWKVPRHGRSPAYCFALGAREAVAEIAWQAGVT